MEDYINIAETNVLTMWKENNIFVKSTKKNEKLKLYNINDGPPFCSGLPHFGHLLVRTVKDTIARYQKSIDKYVPLIGGWDCHGVPIEMMINKKLNINTKESVLELGLDVYNSECKSSVMNCADEWKYTIEKTGKWIDLDNAYKTMDTDYMESVWWGFKTMYEKGLIYCGFKVSPYSIGCTTAFSNSESKLCYKNIDTKSITVKFKVNSTKIKQKDKDFGNTYLLVWTTTPWTLFSNQALCTSSKIEMVEVLCEYDDEFDYEYLIMSKNKFEEIISNKHDKQEFPRYFIIKSFMSSKLKNLKYESLFSYFSANREFSVLVDPYVKDDTGTGIVHLAPAHGDDDFRVCLLNSVIEKDGKGIISLIDENGKFLHEKNQEYSKLYAGKFYENCNDLIIEQLKLSNLLFDVKIQKHSQPHCWRTETPLINRAIKSWFVNIEHIKPNMLSNAEKINWTSSTLKNKFEDGIKSAPDWNISRTRFWGTPIPIWQNPEGETICVGSIEELYTLSGVKVDDLHREYVDNIKIPSKKGNSDLTRVEYVLDCWFESGSMSYAKYHYPFENKHFQPSDLEADFVCESADQLRCWFYNKVAVMTALFNVAPFKNAIVTGLILAEDGQKMSKSKNNYPDPLDIISQHGADALSLYLIGSQLIRAEPTNFKKEMVMQMAKDIIIPLHNTCTFYKEQCKVFSKSNLNSSEFKKSDMNIMDKWIIQATNKFIENLKTDLDKYKLDNITINIRTFVDELNNTYIKLNRTRFVKMEKYPCIHILHEVLLKLSKAISCIIPLCSEHIYQSLKYGSKLIYDHFEFEESVHLCSFPVESVTYDNNIEDSILFMRDIISKVRKIKDGLKNSTAKFPIKNVTISVKNIPIKNITLIKNYIISECNILNIDITLDSSFQFRYKAIPNDKNIGKKFRKKKNEISQLIRKMSSDNVKLLVDNGHFQLENYLIEINDVICSTDLNVDENFKYIISENYTIVVDTNVTEDMKNMYLLRLFKRQIQKCRKDAGLHVWDKIEILYDGCKKIVEIIKANTCKLIDEIGYEIKIKDNKDYSSTSLIEWKGKLNTEIFSEIIIIKDGR